MSTVQLHDKEFEIYISSQKIQASIQRIAASIELDLKGKEPIFLGVLNGAFMFASDLLKNININCHISFVKVASYHGTSSSGKVKELVGINDDLSGKDVIIIEDIVDTGTTIDSIVKDLKERGVASVRVATLLFKPDAYTKTVPIDYAAFEIPNDFVVGYGLDYDGLGRNLKDIYQLKK